MENKGSALEQMNQILADKEALIDKKKNDLAAYRQELGVFEAELSQKTKELQEAQEKLRADEEAFRIYKQSEEEKIAERWNEINVYERNLQKSMEEVLSEKVRLEAHSIELLEKELLEQDEAGLLNEGLNLSALRHAVGIEAEVAQAEKDNQEEETEVSESEISSESRDKEQVVQQTRSVHPGIPELFQRIESEITKSYPRWNKIELLQDRYCLEISTRPLKEIRFILKADKPHVDIVVTRKNAEKDRSVQLDIANLSRIEPDWNIYAKDNSVVHTLNFYEDSDVKALLKKCNDFIKTRL